MTSLVFQVFEEKLEKLQFPTPPKGIHCVEYVCGQKPICYTDFRPHYNPKGMLTSIIVGKHDEWTFAVVKGSYTDPNGIYGYKDDRPIYQVMGSIALSLSLPLLLSNNNSTNSVFLSKWSLFIGSSSRKRNLFERHWCSTRKNKTVRI